MAPAQLPAFKNRSSKIGPRKLPARDPQEREQACRCNGYQRLHLLAAGLHHLRECLWRPSCDTITSPVERSSSKLLRPTLTEVLRSSRAQHHGRASPKFIG